MYAIGADGGAANRKLASPARRSLALVSISLLSVWFGLFLLVEVHANFAAAAASS